MKFAIALFLILSMFSISSEASVGKVASWPVRHPKKSAKHLKHAAQHVGHYTKKVLY